MTMFVDKDTDIRTTYLLDRVQKGFPISKEQSEELSDRGLIGGRWPNIHTVPPVRGQIDNNGDIVEASREEGYEGSIISLITKKGSATRKDIDKLPMDMLPVNMTYAEKEVRIRNIISKMSREGKIINKGSRKVPEWTLDINSDGEQ